MYDDYQQAYYNHCNIKQRHKKTLLKEVIARYKKEQSVLDIQRQLKGLPVVEEKIIQAKEYVFIKHLQVIQTLFTFATPYLEKECKRRMEAINALTAFCCLQKARCLRHPKPSASDIRLKQDIKPLSIFDLPGLSDSILIECKAT